MYFITGGRHTQSGLYRVSYTGPQVTQPPGEVRLAHLDMIPLPAHHAIDVAGLLQAHAAGEVDPGQRIVCTVTGHGLKDPQWALDGAADPVIIPLDAKAAARALGLE